MLKKTRQACISRAKHFVQSHLGTLNPHLPDVHEALINYAFSDDPPGQNAWRTLRYSLVQYYKSRCITDEASFINSIPFPEGAIKKKVSTSVKKVSKEDFMKLLKACLDKKQPDLSLAGALTVVMLTGCRPSEMMSIKLLPDNKILIEGSKKTEDGERGMDRCLHLNADYFHNFSIALKNMKAEMEKLKPGQTEPNAVDRLQKRLDRLYKKLWLTRKKHITFKSFRHQMGSDLKSSGIPRNICAAIMGHQSVNSINRYGDSRSGKRRALPMATQSSIKNVRVTKLNDANFRAIVAQRRANAESSRPAPF